jgi:Enoyl-(Acyl carrier protein) reductase
MTGTTLRRPGDPFPASGVNLPGGRTLHLPDDLAGRFVLSREARCPYRNAQLSAFQRVLDGLAAVDALILELSVNNEATTRDLIARHGLRFQSVTAPTPPRSQMRPARPPTPTRPSCSRPASCSTQAAGPSSARTPAPPSGGSSRKTSSAYVSSGIAAAPGAIPGLNAYAASKAALEAHTLGLAAELAGTGVTVNIVRPGPVDTAMPAWILAQPPAQIGAGLHDRFVAPAARASWSADPHRSDQSRGHAWLRLRSRRTHSLLLSYSTRSTVDGTAGMTRLRP